MTDQKNVTWDNIIEGFKLSKKYLVGSSAILRKMKGSLYSIDIELSEENKKNEEKITSDKKIIAEIINGIVPWIMSKKEFKNMKFSGISIVKNMKSTNELYSMVEKLGAEIIYIDTSEKKEK